MPGTKISTNLSQALRAESRTVHKKKGAVLFRAGALSRGAFLVRKGQVELTLEGGGALYPTRVLGPGSLIGLPATVSGEPYSLTAVAIKDCVLDFIPRARVTKLLRTNTIVALQILQILSEEIAQMRTTARRIIHPENYTVQ